MSGTRHHRRLRCSSVASEAWRNLVTGTSRPLLTAVVVVGVVGGLAASDTRTIVDLSAQATQFRESGAAVHLLTAPEAISGERCEALRTVPGVIGAGAARKPALQAEFLTAPGSGIVTLDVTLGLGDVLLIDGGTRAGIWLSDQAAEALGASPDTTVPTSLGATTVVATYPYPDDASDRTLAYAALTPVPGTGMFDSCWVLAWPQSEAVDALLRATFAGDTEQQSETTFTQLNTKLGTEFDGPELLDGRATARVQWVAALFGLLFGFATVRARRLEFAGALHAQVTRLALVTQVALEYLAMSLAVVVIAAPLTYFLAAHGNPDPLSPAWTAGMRTVLVGVVALVLGAALTALATSQKRLFRYFKER